MAVDRTSAADAGSSLIGIYASLEARLMALVASRLRTALADPDGLQWAERHLRGVSSLRDTADRLVSAAGRSGTREASEAIIEAMFTGRRAALREAQGRLGTKGLGGAISDAVAALNRGADLPGGASINSLAGALSGRLGALQLPIVRWVSDAFQDVIFAGAVPGIQAGLDTRRKAASSAWNRLLNQGITGMTDTRGRRWNLSTYVEMSTRTATSQASIEAHNAQLSGLGLSLVIVSDVAGECIICRPWEGKILTTAGQGGPQKLRVQRLDSDAYVEVSVAGSVSEARAAGLFHPNCRHSINAYFPGLTKIPTSTADPKTDAARRELRGLERETRKWKTREAAALTPQDAARARAKVREKQAKITELIKTRGGVERGLPRRRDREQIDLGNTRTPGAGSKATTGPSPTKPKPTTSKPKPAPKPKPVTVSGGPPNPKTPAPVMPRLHKPYERFDPPRDSKYFDPDKHPFVPKTPPRGDRGYYEPSGAPFVDYGPGAHVPKLSDIIAGRAHIDHLFGLTTKANRRLIPAGEFEDEIRAGLELFGEIAPRSLLELREISGVSLARWQTYGQTANAFFVTYEDAATALAPWRVLAMNPNWFDRYGRNDIVDLKQYGFQSGWSSQSAYPGSGATLLHELGHHLQTMMYPGRPATAGPLSVYSPLDQRIVDVIVRELGLKAPTGGTTGLSAAGMTKLIESYNNQARVAELVSTYGSRSFEEMFAEIFQEYATLGIDARPHIIRIGEAIIRLAETGKL